MARLTSFSAGRELALALRPSTDQAEVVRRQRLTAEARRLVELRPTVGLGGAHDVRPLTDKAARGAVLQPTELLEIAATLAAAGELRATVKRVADELPLLATLAGEFEPLPDLVAELTRSIDARGEITDAASPTLSSLRRNARIAHDRLNARLEEIIHSSQYRDAIQEPIITLRDGRYVIPVKADQRGKIRGIVHDISASGATVFLEPLSVVELGNSWRELKLDEEREVERVLRELSGLVGESADDIIDTVAALAGFDLALAKARLGEELSAPELPHAGAEQPWIVAAGATLHLLNARHPLLSGDVVPVTVTVGDEYTTLLITGPNTGGKTVAMKTVGLLALMHQSGIHIPAEEGSALPVFDGIFADIGDQQSIADSVSTFGSHISNVIQILKNATPRSLVLLDELGNSTDPEEGSAIAKAIIGNLAERRIPTIVTTHHRNVAAFAEANPHTTNGSFQLDPDTLEPTYQLTMGVRVEATRWLWPSGLACLRRSWPKVVTSWSLST